MPDLAGRTLGSYRLVEQSAAGGMAVIFKAYDESLDRYVAIKILPDYLSRDADFSARFRNEARNVARLRHPNILPIFGYGEEDGLSYFVMDLVEGGTLKDLIGAPLPLNRVVELITQVAGALQYAHEQGVVHRDVKPSNVLMLRPDWALLSDFGIARVLEQTANVTHTGSAFFGTPHYMAPEQARGEPVSPKTDQYALGIVLYEMLTGATPYRADTPQAVVYQHIYSPPPPPHEKNPAISTDMEAVILRALAKDPDERHASMADFARAVRQAMSPSAPAARSVEPAPGETVADAFPPQSATPAFRPAVAATRGTTGPFTERIDIVPEAEERAEESRPPVARRRPPLWVFVAGGAAALVVVAAIAFLALRGSGSSAPTVRVALVGPASVPITRYTIQDDGGHQVAAGSSDGNKVSIRLAAGRYSFTPINLDRMVLPVGFTVASSDPQTIDLTRLYGRLSIRPPAGRVTVSGFDLQRPHLSVGVNSIPATEGIFVAPGEYAVNFYASEFPVPPQVIVRAGQPTVLDLRRTVGQLVIRPAAGAPVSGLDVHRFPSGSELTGLDSSQVRGGVFLPPGGYSLVFYNSDVFVDSVPATVVAGGSTTLDLNRVLARVDVPSAPPNTLTYSWREGSVLDTIAAASRAQTVYIRAGTYRVEINDNGSTRVITVRAAPGTRTRLPPR